MASVNKVILVGNLGQSPELKYLPSGQAVCEFSIATTDVFNDKQGQRQERTEWHRIKVWGKTAENCGKYLEKGRQVYIEGRIQTRSYDKDGQKHYITEVVANQVVFLSSGGGAGAGGPRGASGGSSDTNEGGPAPAGNSDGPPDFDGGGNDDIPF